jgi:hypothetical protein
MKRVRMLLAVLLVVALAAGIGVSLGIRKPLRREWPLVRGGKVRVLKVTRGTSHVFLDGSWRENLYPFTPDSLRTRLNWKPLTARTPGDLLVIWLKLDQPPNSSYGSASGGPMVQIRTSAVDADGLESPAFAQMLGQMMPNNLYAVGLDHFPGRGKEIVVRIYDGSQINGEKLGQFKISNPSPDSGTRWTSEKLPARRETNGLSISLVKLQTGWCDIVGSKAVSPRSEETGKFSSVSVELREHGAPTKNWKVASVSAVSASGERWNSNEYRDRWRDKEYTLFFRGALWRDEPAWKISVEAMRVGNFPTQETWTVRGIRVPKPQEVVEVRAATNIHNIEVELLGLGGPNTVMPEAWGHIGYPLNRTELRVRMTPGLEDRHLFVAEVRDEQGNKLESNEDAGDRDFHGFRIVVPDSAQALDITLAVTKSTRVEFFAKSEPAK